MLNLTVERLQYAATVGGGNLTGADAGQNCTEMESAVQEMSNFVVYYVMTPVMAALGFVGHWFCLAVFRQQRRTQGAYVYQICVTVSQAAEMLSYLIFVSTFFWLTARPTQAPWFVGNYTLMWLTATFSEPLLNFAIINTCLFTVCMTADRALALVRPAYYKLLNHKRQQSVSVLLCVLVGALVSLFEVFRYDVREAEDGGGYYLADSEFKYSSASQALSRFRTAFLFLSLCVLIACTGLILHFYRQRVRKAKQLNKNKEEALKADEKTLYIVTVCQASMMVIGMVMFAGYFTVFYELQSTPCSFYGTQVFDVFIQLSAISDFYLLFCFNRRFRQLALEVICHRKVHDAAAAHRLDTIA